jgi:Patatin-like phospholipase
VLKKVIHDAPATKNENAPLSNDSNGSCAVFVVATRGQIANGPVKLFRSYGHDRDETPMWQVARATTAAPVFFPPALVDSEWFVDGGVNANNPTSEAVAEGKNHWKTTKCFTVSVGTGKPKRVDLTGNKPRSEAAKNAKASAHSKQTHYSPPNTATPEPNPKTPSKSSFGAGLRKVGTQIAGTFQAATARVQSVTDIAAQLARVPGGIEVGLHIMNGVVALSTNSESTHRRVYGEAHSQDESAKFPYFRFNVDEGMEDIGLEEWKKVVDMTSMTRSYLDEPEVKADLKNCAKGLVFPSAFEGK